MMQMKEAAHAADMARATQDMRELKLEIPSVQLQVAAAALASERAENAAAMAAQKHTATAPTGPNMAESSES